MQNAKELLGARIKEIRKSRQLSQERLAEKVGVEPKQISRIEGGKSSPSMDTLEAIARELHVEMKELFDYQHLLDEDNIEDQAQRILRMMDDKTKRLAIRLLRTLST
jgi:transcriptional regulator with XRE-family HTH domain